MPKLFLFQIFAVMYLGCSEINFIRAQKIKLKILDFYYFLHVQRSCLYILCIVSFESWGNPNSKNGKYKQKEIFGLFLRNE